MTIIRDEFCVILEFVPVAALTDEGLVHQPFGNDHMRQRGQHRDVRAGLQRQVEVRCKGGRVLKVEAALEPSLLQALIRVIEAA